MPTIGVIVLAAGSSSRLGRPKQTLLYGGKTLLARAIETALEVNCGPVVVVTGANRDIVEPVAAAYPVQIAFNADWIAGMNISIRAGLDALTAANETLSSVIVATCDQPFLSAELLRELIRVHEESGKPIIASDYAGTQGVPALFDASLFPELRTLPDGAGAGRLIAAYGPERTAVVLFPDGAADVDTPEDFARLVLRNEPRPQEGVQE